MAENRFRLTYDEERFIEGFAAGLDAMMLALTGDSPSAKSYDPMKVEGAIMYSYAFDMKNGGRRHPVSDYTSLNDILETLTKEAVDWVKHDD